jgi:hypothetical protein
MRTFIVGLVTIAVVGVSACGSDDSAGSSATDSPAPTATEAPAATEPDMVAIVTAKTVEQIEGFGYTVDAECVRGIVSQLSEGDLAILAEASADADPELSPEGDDLGDGILTCTDGGGSPELVAAVKQLLIDSPDGDQLDVVCLDETLPSLSDDQLQLMLDSGPDSTDPKMMGAAMVVFGCANFMQDAGGTVPLAEAQLIDPCTILTDEERTSLLETPPEGESSSIGTMYGDGSMCKWLGDAGKELTVMIIGAPDVEAWQEQSSNGDGVGDATPVAGVGEAAFSDERSLTFLSGDWLVEIKVFPSFAADIGAITEVATAVAERI